MALALSTAAGLELVRILAVCLLIAGGLALGISAGLRLPVPALTGGQWIRGACCLAAVALTAPVLVALAAAVIRAAGTLERVVPATVQGLSALALLAAGAAALVVGCRAVLLPVARQQDEADGTPP